MKKSGFRLPLGALALAFCLHAQGSLVMTSISASASDATFSVDGQNFVGAAAFSWPAGSKHTLEIAVWQYTPGLPPGRYVFQHWTTPSGPLASSSNVVTVTADPGIPSYVANLTTEYSVSLVFFQCDVPPCASPGTIWVNQVAYSQDVEVWLAAGSTVTLEADPNPGFIFAGWSQGPGLAPLYAFTLNAPAVVYPLFVVARPVELLTSPVGLKLLADRGLVTAPVTLDWGIGTAHTLSPVSPQSDNQGRQWVFSSWSDGGASSHTYQVPAGPSTVSITAQFVRAVPAMFLTDPPGLTLTVDGVGGPAPRYASWGPGETHTVSAQLNQTDSAGGPWAFRQWSNGAGATQTIQVTDAQVDTGIRLTAEYDPLSRVHVDSTPSGLNVTVDGAACQTPCDVDRPVGTVVHVSAPASIAAGSGMRLDFGSWEGAPGVLTTVAGYQKIIAHYQWSYQLTLSMSPASGGAWRISPASGDGFYSAGTALSVGVEASPGMKFRQWGQDLGGAANPAALVMDAPHTVQAIFDKLPDAPTAPRVANAAGETPIAAVAAGAIAALFGDKLAAAAASSSASPLPQSLGGVSLSCAGHLLPLLFVSPQQINFQVPGDLQPGQYQLDVYGGSTPVSVKFDVVRNAPGLLAATHLDGSPITPDAPASPGEAVALFGTGLGPYQPMPIDGFQIPSNPSFAVADAVTVQVQGRNLSPDSATAAVGSVGVALVQVRLPADLDPSSPATVAIRAGDAWSNVLPLPLKPAQ